MSDEHPPQSPFLEGRLQSLLDHMSDLPEDQRTSCALAAAALVLEYAAYELARTETPKHVARLILLSADLERTAAELRNAISKR